MAVLKNYYAVLEVETFAEADAVKAAYRRLARQHHPDLNANNKAAEEKFKEINEAYEILSDPDKRAKHDLALGIKMGVNPKAKAGNAKARPGGPPPKNPPPKAKPGAQSGAKSPPPESKSKETPRPDAKGDPRSAGMPINEFFETFLKKGFSDEGRARADTEEGVFRPKHSATEPGEKPKRGEDVVVKTAISPNEAQEGVVKTVNVQHNEICRRCSGTGKVNGQVCNACNGDKVSVRLKKIDVRIPAGVKNGSRVRVAKEGGRGAGGAENGDLFLQIEIAYDPSLRIEGLDVYGDAPVSVTDAVLGGEIEVSTLNGPVKMMVPAGTQTGKVFRLKERGVQSGMAKGDHFVTVVVMIPENLTARERELYQELSRLRPEKPGPRKAK